MKQILIKMTSWMMAHTAWITLVISPVALGKEAANISAQNLKAALQDLQLNKNMTMKEFWEKTKADYPGYAYGDMEELVKYNPNAIMPQFQIKSVKGSDGNEVPVITFVENGKTHTIQIYGENKKYMTFDGVNITEAESTQPQKIIQKLMDADSKLQQQYDAAISNTTASSVRSEMRNTLLFSSYDGLPRMTPQMWAAMSQIERAKYLVEIRSMWQAARKVNFYSDKSRIPASQKSSPKKKTSSLEKMYKVFFGQDAEAQAKGFTQEQCVEKYGPAAVVGDADNNGFNECYEGSAFLQAAKDRFSLTKKPVNKTPVVVAPKQTTPPKAPKVGDKENPISETADQKFNELECTNAGWITVNSGKSKKCSYGALLEIKNDRYNPDFVRKVVEECGPTKVACNPLVYGYPQGRVLCVGKEGSRSAPAKGNYQKATHWDGPCDSGSRLTSGAFLDDANNALNSGKLTQAGKYVTGDARKAQLDAIESDPENAKLSQAFLDGVLKREGKGDSFVSALAKGVWDEATDNLMVQTQLNFEAEIAKAIGNCEINAPKAGQYDTNQKGACEQLHRRWLSLEKLVSDYRSKACPDQSKYLFNMRLEKSVENAKQLNRTAAKDLNSDDKNLPCGCYDKDKKLQRFPLGTSPEKNAAAKKICDGSSLVPPGKCPGGSTALTADPTTCQCNSANGDTTKQFKIDDLKEKTVLPEICGNTECNQVILDSNGKLKADDIAYDGSMCKCKNGNELVKVGGFFTCEKQEVVSEKCDQYPPLNTSGKLNDQCQCIDKKGKTKGLPKKVNTGIKGWFTSSGKKTEKLANDKMTPDAKGDRYTCDQGPNWWVIGGIAAGVAGLLAILLWPKKKKCPTGSTGKYPHCKYPNCTPPFQSVGNECVCNLRCPEGQQINPTSCTCSPLPSEGGEGEGGGDYGGVGTGQ